MSTRKSIALVTGGTAGIGLGLALRLRDRGHHVIISVRRPERVDALCAEHGFEGVAADVSDAAGRERIVAAVREHGRLAVLVNNAGRGGGTSGIDVDAARAADVLETNFYSHIDLTNALWPLLRDARGSVIVVSSGLGTFAARSSPTYGASKAALTSWARALRVVGRRDGVRVLAANPGPVATEQFPHDALLADRFRKHEVIGVDQCCDDIMRGLDRNRPEIWTRGAIRIPAIVQGLAPNTFDRFFV